MKLEIVRARLEGIEKRNEQRQTKRRIQLAEHLERKRMGRAEKYRVAKWKRA